MNEVKIYSISDAYISYLKCDPRLENVFENKSEIHVRKYLGVVFSHGEFNYFVPFSSPKESDYLLTDGGKVIRKSIIPIIRMTTKDTISGKIELKGTLKLSNMVPVPETELVLYDIEAELDRNYKELVKKEWAFIRSNIPMILKHARVLYNQKTKAVLLYSDGKTPRYLASTVDFQYAEQKCKEYQTK